MGEEERKRPGSRLGCERGQGRGVALASAGHGAARQGALAAWARGRGEEGGGAACGLSPWTKCH